ncbi:hypothetical protein FUAX_15830 [Fulvitalea axinellae]|uniref:HTH marR-type domain-containing protein n=1 Tax=Fulvitalea axinellae TaxID=1182444 RepID=A0AAU9CJR3_9BACT|nr:hypothetical protein FUAX_15830 [Fulvitalea axinellae]
MGKDYLKTLEYVGFTARLKRLSDTLIYDAKEVYKQLDLEIEPNWHVIILLLKKEEKLSVTEISKKLGFSHPAVIKITRKMKEKGFLNSVTDKTDSRKQLLSLSEKTIQCLPALEQQWDLIQKVIKEFVSPSFLKELDKTEDKLSEKSLLERVIK